MSEHDCPLSPAQRAAYRDWQVREVLRRREAGKAKASLGAAAVESLRGLARTKAALALAGDAALDRRIRSGAPGACPRCGKPYGKRARCYDCSPGGNFGSGKGSR